MNKWIKFIICILICQLAGFIGSIFTTPAIGSWYLTLIKPSFTPPNWLFGPVWITLYTLMGISLYFVWKKDLENKKSRTPFIVFTVQLILNILWSYIFFGLQGIFYGLIEIVLLWMTIAVTIFSFYKVSRTAGLLLIPYIAWVTIATFLNYSVWMLNP